MENKNALVTLRNKIMLLDGNKYDVIYGEFNDIDNSETIQIGKIIVPHTNIIGFIGGEIPTNIEGVFYA